MHVVYYSLAAVAALIVLFILVVATRPAEFCVVRMGTIAAPVTTVFALVNDFHRWAEWSPGEKIDPNLQRMYEGPAQGVGAIYKWVGNKKVGEGMMTIVDSLADVSVRIKLQFIKPWSATNEASFTFTTAHGQTVVSWIMTGRNNFMAKAFTMFFNMDKMIGKDFEKGLANMKAAAEGASAT